MKWRSTLVLALLALLALAFALLWERRQPTGDEAARRAKRIFDCAGTDVLWIEVDRDGTLVRIERQKDGAAGTGHPEGEETAGGSGRSRWRITRPLSDRADPWIADSLARQICELESRRELDAASPPPPDAEAGLAPPRTRIRFDAGAGPKGLAVGREAPGTGAVYARVEGETIVRLVDRYFDSDLSRRTDEWRDPSLLDVAALDLGAMEVIRPAGRLRFERKNEAWQFSPPRTRDADGAKVQSLLSDLLALRTDGFPPPSAGAATPRVPSSAGAAPAAPAEDSASPSHTVRLFLRDGTEAGLLAFGAPAAESSERVHCRVAGREGLFLVEKRILAELDQPAENFEKEPSPATGGGEDGTDAGSTAEGDSSGVQPTPLP